ncbi:EF-hand calcium-binding domain-containing protein 4B-like isoform X5 [Mytilus californianus]|uniref:EF-hand calcium-binding domain-containing protein 4B-like isoform X5 n=1 Tax=Mytilus californianus TaxID=6549 RepID=UPI00224852F5|nr:EF-hand calcium-binding domain-containing protein 4B-like isoform X5 [Mytilus californianus]
MSSAYDDHLSKDGRGVSEEEVQQMAKQKAHELFSVCDIEQKGFITKRDMQRLQNELPLLPDQLEAVFDSLDDDGNGYLTLEEFTEGFGSYLGINFMGDSTMEGDDTLENVYEGEERQEEEKQFTDMMENIGAKSLFDDENTIRHLWMKIRRDEPEMVGNFEEFLYKTSTDLRKTKADFDTLENALKSKSSAHDEEVRKLYEEMEYQIKKEKERILSEEQLKERNVRETLERDLEEKDKQLQELLNRHSEMEKKLEVLNLVETETKQENEKLAKDKEELEDMLMKSQVGLEDSKMYIDQLRHQQKKEKQDRARSAIKLTESIALERESLVKQLDTLKDVNKKLRDDKDEAEIRRDLTSNPETDDPEQILEAEAGRSSPRKKELFKQGSILGDYFPTSRRKFESTAESIEESLDVESGNEDGFSDDDIECDDDDLIENNCANLNNNDILYGDSDDKVKGSYYGHDSNKLDQSLRSSDEDEAGKTDSNKSRHKPKRKIPSKKPGFHPVSDFHGNDEVLQGTRGQPVGADIETNEKGVESTVAMRQRIFKVVFVGDSGVGKSSFIHRFCNDNFNPTFSATIGVDFQVKSLILGGQSIVLQLWDTAGQERFRSITKQYFRKADGVVIMYDVNSEATYTNVRNWMESVQEGVEEGTVVLLVGNKTDIAESESDRAVKTKDGNKLSVEYDGIFFETSAKMGNNVKESMEAMASILKEKEDKEIEKALHLDDSAAKKKFCCG